MSPPTSKPHSGRSDRLAWGVFLLSITCKYPVESSVYAWIVSGVTPAGGRGTAEQEAAHNEAIAEWGRLA